MMVMIVLDTEATGKCIFFFAGKIDVIKMFNYNVFRTTEVTGEVTAQQSL